jgi:hypothetical protein
MIDTATTQSQSTPDVRILRVRKFRQIVCWPLQLMPLRDDAQIHRHWQSRRHAGAGER